MQTFSSSGGTQHEKEGVQYDGDQGRHSRNSINVSCCICVSIFVARVSLNRVYPVNVEKSCPWIRKGVSTTL